MHVCMYVCIMYVCMYVHMCIYVYYVLPSRGDWGHHNGSQLVTGHKNRGWGIQDKDQQISVN